MSDVKSMATSFFRTGAKLKGGFGGVTHPPQLPISQGTEEVCRAKMWFRFRLQTVCCSMSMKMSMSVENFLGFITVTKKRETRRALHNGRAVYPFFHPPNQKVLVSPLLQKFIKFIIKLQTLFFVISVSTFQN